jgi:diketogulonate reductase-like aldo/keto reductase
MTQIPSLRLNDGVEIPQLGFGVFQVPPQDTERAVSQALETGYRHIDTAAAYQNEEGVGKAIAASGIARDELFVTTKLWNADQGREEARRAFETSLGKLGLEQLDLYLIHWPTPARDLYAPSWSTFQELQAEGRVRSIGVSNFQPDHLRRLIDEFDVVPSINQVELHPYLQQDALRAFHAEHGIATEAWSPLAQGAVLDEPVLTEIAQAHGKTTAQVVLRWHLQLGNVVIPKSVTPKRIAENLDVFDVELTEQQLGAIATLDRGQRIGPDPDVFETA